MSAYIAACYPGRVEMVSDGASFDFDGKIEAMRSKITPSDLLPLAVVGVGVVGDIALLKVAVLEATQACSTVDEVIERLHTDLPRVERRSTPSSITIVAFSESSGGQIWEYNNERKTLRPYWDSHAIGPELSMDEMRASGADITQSLREGGVRLLEAMRRKPCQPVQEVPFGHYVGGHIDWCVVDKNGVRIERVHEWPDVVGEKIEVA
ncbi:hypothetical protein NO932_08635 [Pelagibacterium sp. 26DY04]|uniref:hypothetical protein n=1 Tax=Pelagibacterium sp. 26DY04 TaxID=2967130 RepID=UPI0028158490|nr:hypothetical protein [Pelagibacterium sp. 26DY04]WMT88655.1 hypothetical protein NO932_08635 [Pelagibacterium sp. 26DY04]